MILTTDQIQELTTIIDKNHLIVIGKQFGDSFLSSIDKQLLTQYGVDWKGLYNIEHDVLAGQFHLGMLAESLMAASVQNLSYQDLLQYVKRGDYIPLTQRETLTLNAMKQQTCIEIKTLGNRIFQDLNNKITDIRDQRSFLSQELMEGYIDKKTVSEIAHSIAEKTQDWSRDFDRIIAYNSHKALEEGKAAMIERDGGADVLVYKQVYEGACKHCVEKYLTNGIGSQPRIFKLSQLRANGNNIGRKVADWLATLGPLHSYCRCRLFRAPKNAKWTGKSFDKEPEKPKRAPIKVWIQGVLREV